MNTKCSLLLLLLPFVLSACGLVSDTPLSSPRNAPRDNRLEGIWRSKDPSDHSYTYIAYGSANTGAILSFDSRGIIQPLDLHRYNFFVTRTPKNSFLNVTEVSATTGKPPANQPPAWSFVRYRFTWTGTLEATLVDGPAFAAAVRAGTLHGTIDKNGTVTVRHAPPDRLLTIIENSRPDDVFQKAAYFKKIAGP